MMRAPEWHLRRYPPLAAQLALRHRAPPAAPQQKRVAHRMPPALKVQAKLARLEETRKSVAHLLMAKYGSLRSAFMAIDAEGVGAITAEQLKATLVRLNASSKVGILLADLDWLVRACDDDQNGELSYEEFQRHIIKEKSDLPTEKPPPPPPPPELRRPGEALAAGHSSAGLNKAHGREIKPTFNKLF